jgi:hypothetical protein
MTLIEVVIASTTLVAVLLGAEMMVSASSGVAQSTNDQGIANERAARVLRKLSGSLRKGSLASARRLDGLSFLDGGNDSGFQIREVLNFNGTPILGGLVSYRFDSATGEVIESEDGFDTVIAREVTSFSVQRSGTMFIFDVRTRSGPTDDRGRTAHATMQVAARNP